MDGRAASFDRQIQDVVTDLSGEFQSVVGRDVLERVVKESFDELSDARIKGFVPILARRLARQRLRTRRVVA